MLSVDQLFASCILDSANAVAFAVPMPLMWVCAGQCGVLSVVRQPAQDAQQCLLAC